VTRALGILVAVAVWSILPPYVGPTLGLDLDVSSTVEVIDHLIPGLLAICGATLALVLTRRGEGDSALAFAGLALCALAGLFQTVSHVPLLADAGGPLAPVGSVVLHATPGPVLLGLSMWLLLTAPASDTATE
jgi:hypothetical protein